MNNNEWVSIDDKLPEPDSPVEIAYRVEYSGFYYPSCLFSTWIAEGSNCNVSKITHWRYRADGVQKE